MLELRLGIPNSPSFRYRALSGLLALFFLLAAVVPIVLAVQQRPFFMRHPFLWGMAGLALVVICAGMVLVLLDEARPYEKGQMLLTEEGITIGDDTFLLGMIRQITVAVRGQQGQVGNAWWAGRNSISYLTLLTHHQQQISCDFWLKSKAEFVLLEQLLAIWQRQKVVVVRAA
jgi:hypothetical protein